VSATRSNTAKTGSTALIQRLGALRDGIKGLFKVIRTSRVVLRHLEACLVELYAVSSQEIDSLPAPPVPTETPPAHPTVSLGTPS